MRQRVNDVKRVLVSGGAGFIGASVVRRLLDSGESVRVLDSLSGTDLKYLEGLDIEVEIADIRNSAAVRGALAGCYAVVHLAAETAVLPSVEDPLPSFTVNCEGTLSLLRASQDRAVKRFILASSNAAIGEHEPPLHEGLAPAPVSPYGASKLAGEAYCSAFHGSYGLGTIALRFANAYGPYSGRKTSVIAKLLKQVLEGAAITVYGDGRQTRDFIYVDDIAQAVELALASELGGRVYHIGTGRETSVLDLVDLIKTTTGIDVPLQWMPQLRGEIRRNFSDISRARNELGFSPRWALEDGLRQTFAWLKAEAQGKA